MVFCRMFFFQSPDLHPRPDLTTTDFVRQRVGSFCQRVLLEGGWAGGRLQPQVSRFGPH